MPALSGKAFAKVNLGLRIGERRPDGFHELRTVLQTVSLADRLRVSFEPGRRSRVELRCSDPSLESERNLASRAAHALLDRGAARGTVRIELDKRIPHGAGLGGGSSDAAAVLTALERLIIPAPSAETLYEAAAALGSDVPFFLLGGRAVGIGRGEEVYPLPEPPRRWLLLLVPGVRMGTAEAYAELAKARAQALTRDRKGPILSSFCSGFRASENGAPDADAHWVNDFEETVFHSLPAIEPLKQRLREAGAACALLSGSGSALFGLFESRREALKARELFRAPGSELAVKAHVVRTVGSGECRRSWSKQ